MVRKSIDIFMRWYLAQRYKRIKRYMDFPVLVQERWLDNMKTAASFTEWGKQYDFSKIKTRKDFASCMPIQDYESLKPYIERMMLGEPDVLWGGEVKWFSKSSGTTSSKSKFIPVSSQNLRHCHIKGTWDTMSIIYNQLPHATQFRYKTLLMGGCIDPVPGNPRARTGDVSAIMIEHMPRIARPFFTPDFEIALMKDFEEKLEIKAKILSKEKDMVMIGGVPTWLIVLFRKILRNTGKDNMLEVWPNLQVYTHGGVSFAPYKKQFAQFFPGDQVKYFEIYNASEGYFGMQHGVDDEDMLLLMDSGVYYEFLPQSEWYKENKETILLEDIEIGKNYALVISTNAGLWRYTTGDTISFTSTKPFRFKITGRINQFVNAFGEEVIVENTDRALARTCESMPCSITDYTVAPKYFEGNNKGGHEWLIEFKIPPQDLNLFASLLDENLKKLNSDYEAKRFNDLALLSLKITSLPPGTFSKWFKSKGRYTTQAKVPRLANHREYVDDILQILHGS